MGCLSGDNSPELSNKTRQMSALFGSTYICEHIYYKINLSKDLLREIQFKCCMVNSNFKDEFQTGSTAPILAVLRQGSMINNT
jgi:hypothetical protein